MNVELFLPFIHALSSRQTDELQWMKMRLSTITYGYSGSEHVTDRIPRRFGGFVQGSRGRGASEGGRFKVEGGRGVGSPKFSRFFFPFPPQMFTPLSSLSVFFRGILVVFLSVGLLSCAASAAPKPSFEPSLRSPLPPLLKPPPLSQPPSKLLPPSARTIPLILFYNLKSKF